MKSGKAYCSLHINSEMVWKELVLTNKNATRKDSMMMIKYIRTNLKAQTNNVTDFEFMEDANSAWDKLDEATKKYVSVTECTPVSLGLGWC
jgi:hypothetical protein